MATIEAIEVHDYSYSVANLEIDDHRNIVPASGGTVVRQI